MKLAKKMLACAMALALVAVFALTAFAAAPSLSVTATKAVVGKEFTVSVSATSGFTGAECGSMYFTFDPEVVEFVSLTSADDGFLGDGGMVIDTNNQISFAFMFAKAATKDASALCTITFKALKEGDAKIAYTCEDWSGVDAPAGASVPVTVVPVPVETTTAAPETTTKAPVEPGSENNTNKLPQTGVAGASVAAIAGVMAIAAVAFVATKKKDEE